MFKCVKHLVRGYCAYIGRFWADMASDTPFIGQKYHMVEPRLGDRKFLPMQKLERGLPQIVLMILKELRHTAAPLAIAAVLTAVSAPALGQDAESAPPPTQPDSDTIESANTETGTPEGSPSEGNGNIYLPEYFAQYAPRNALDMVRQIPGFTISGGGNDGGGGGGRGLGQANENLLVNGERLSSKSDSARDQIARIPAGDVIRIEILDGTSLDIPGLSGQVANVVSQSTGVSGQFEWRTGFRAYNAKPQLFGGEISVSGTSGQLDYTLAISNRNNRFGADGPNIITDGAGTIIQRDESRFNGGFDNPTFSANLKYDFSSDVTANLNASFQRSWFFIEADEEQFPVGGGDLVRTNRTKRGGPEYEITSDVEFPLGGGQMKLIALYSYDEGNSRNTLVDTFTDGSDDTGSRFTVNGVSKERIGRFEYGWDMWGADWQLSGEAAFNTLDRVSGLFELDSAGEFIELDFPEGTGAVSEDRYETILSFSRQLTGKLALQATIGGEYSRIEQTGFAANMRSFQRPKGSLSLAWKPEAGLDISLEARRKVGQLSFGDILARVFLDEGNEDAGNNELVPEQSWDYSLEINKSLGKWGSTTLTLERRQIEDYIDVIPLADGGESRGNIDRATATAIEWNSTFKLGPIGINGAEIDLEVEYRPTKVRDPVTGENRPFSGQTDFQLEADFRHDIPNSSWAYGFGIQRRHNTRYYRLSEFGREFEGPVFARLFIEHKDVFGLTVNAQYTNVLNARNRLTRTVFDGVRGTDPVLFSENSNRRIGPIFRFSVSGNF